MPAFQGGYHPHVVFQDHLMYIIWVVKTCKIEGGGKCMFFWSCYFVRVKKPGKDIITSRGEKKHIFDKTLVAYSPVVHGFASEAIGSWIES